MLRREFITSTLALPIGLGFSTASFSQTINTPVIVNDPVSSTDIDAVITEIKSLPFTGIGIISGEINWDKNFSKLMRLDIAQKSTLNFLVQKTSKRIYLVAKEVFIQGPANAGAVSQIAYKLLDSFDQTTPQKAPGGANGADKTGQPGGAGADGKPGANGISYDAPEIYFVFEKLTVQNALPGLSTTLNFNFPGLQGGNGGRGGDGGDGGNGGKGTDAENHKSNYPWPARGQFEDGTCAAGPGRGGDSGKPGSGGRGGDAARGGNGARVIIICPESEKSKVAFAATIGPGNPGQPGQPGSPGSVGTPGGGGDLSSYCRGGRPGGSQLGASPANLGSGNSAPPGNLGSYQVVYRNVSDIFSVF